MQVRFPLLALCLVGFNSIVFFVGSSILRLRPGCFTDRRVFRRLLASRRATHALEYGPGFLFAILSVHCNYQNSYLLLGIGVAAAAVAAPQRKWMRSMLVLAMCFVAALSMLLYAPIITRYRGEMIISNYQELSVGIVTLLDTMEAHDPLLLLGWIADRGLGLCRCEAFVLAASGKRCPVAHRCPSPGR